MAGTHPLAGATDLWEDVIDDLEATAREYEADGWETVVCHPGDVTPLPTTTALVNGVDVDRIGLDLLVPGNEYEQLAEAVEGVSFDEYDAFRAESGSLVFLVVVMKGDDGTAVCFPIYYDADDAEIMLKRAYEGGQLRTYLRPLDDSERVVFAHGDPERLAPTDFDPEEVDEESLLAAEGSDQSRYPLGGDDLEQLEAEIEVGDEEIVVEDDADPEAVQEAIEQAREEDTDDTA